MKRLLRGREMQRIAEPEVDDQEPTTDGLCFTGERKSVRLADAALEDSAMSTVQKNGTAGDIMTPDPKCATPSMSIRELARMLEENGISGTPVVDREGRVIGVVSRKDLIRRCTEGTPERAPGYLFEVILDREERGPAIIPEPLICVEDFMTPNPVTVPPELPVRDVARRMFEARVRRAIVVDANRAPIGIVTCLDLLGVLTE